jgi:alanine racemase
VSDDATPPLRSVRIDTSAIAHNVRVMRAAVGNSSLHAQVSPGEYGGIAVARAAVRAGVDGLVVATVDDGVALRRAAIDAPTLAWLHGSGDAARAAEHGITPLVASVTDLSAAVEARHSTAYLAVATGDSVIGCRAEDWDALVALAARLEDAGEVRISGIIGMPGRQTPHAGGGLGAVSSERGEFALRTSQARNAGLSPSRVGLHGSVAALATETDGQEVSVIRRALYGLSPTQGKSAEALGLTPAMRVSARVIATKAIKAGEGISYGHTYRTAAPGNLALVSIGYVHGVDRRASNRCTGWLNGRSYPIAGRVAMDVLVLDLGEDTAQTGDEVVLFGSPADGHPSVEGWAAAIGASTHSVVAGFATQAARDTSAHSTGQETAVVPASGEAAVDLDAYRRNLALLKRQVPPADLMVVVKGDAYGHGLLPITRTAIAQGITRIGVLDTATGMALRDAGIGRDISLFAWLLSPDEDYRAAIDSGLELGVSQVAQLHGIARSGAAERARLHLKIDTGLHRNGANEEDWPELVREALALERSGQAEVYAAWSHIAEASDEEDTAAVRRFEAAIQVAEALGARFSSRHLAASAAGFARADCRFDLVRMGAFTFGISPGGGITPADLGLTPVMTLSAPVTDVVVRGGRMLAIVPLGFSHGIPTGAPGVVPVTIGGRRYPIVDQIEHGHLVVDVGAQPKGPDAAPKVLVGDRVIIFGNAHDGELTLQEWADALDTIGEELVVRVSRSIPRRYLG